jgi:hypothetical protein
MTLLWSGEDYQLPCHLERSLKSRSPVTNYVMFDLETVPDLEIARRL